MENIKIGNRSFSKLICGTNPFYGHSHFSEARAFEYRNRFTDDVILKVVNTCLKRGINTVETSANERIFKILADLNINNSDNDINIISSTRIDETSKVKRHQEKLDMSIKNKCSICMIHSQFIEKELKGNCINGIEDFLSRIHVHGLLAGISTHSNTIIELCEKRKYDIDVYMFPLNITGFIYPGYQGNETPKERASLVKSIEKPFIIMKSMAAGRIPPSEALQFVYENSKKNDLLTIGFGSCEEADETIEIWEAFTRR